MDNSSWLRRRSRATRAFLVLAALLVAYTIAGRIVVGESTSSAANVAWIVQMILLAGCLVTGGLAVAAELRGRSDRQEVAR